MAIVQVHTPVMSYWRCSDCTWHVPHVKKPDYGDQHRVICDHRRTCAGFVYLSFRPARAILLPPVSERPDLWR